MYSVSNVLLNEQNIKFSTNNNFNTLEFLCSKNREKQQQCYHLLPWPRFDSTLEGWLNANFFPSNVTQINLPSNLRVTRLLSTRVEDVRLGTLFGEGLYSWLHACFQHR